MGCQDGPKLNALSRLVFITTSGGHPQLVHGRAHYFRSRDWPDISILDTNDIPDVKKARHDARQILISDIPSEDARTLAYRLSVLGGVFRRDAAIALCDISPAIHLPGEVFDSLVGPWIEDVYGGHYRVSPLIDKAAESVWGRDKIREIQSTAAEATLELKELTPVDADGILRLALASGNDGCLARICLAIMQAPEWAISQIARISYWFMVEAIVPNQRIHKDDIFNAFLRAVQFTIAIKSNEIELQKLILTAWANDVGLIEEVKARHLMLMGCLSNLLIHTQIHFELQFIVETFSKFIDLYDSVSREHFPLIDKYVEKLPKEMDKIKDIIQLISELQTARIHSTNDLKELFVSLEYQPARIRNRILAPFNDVQTGMGLAEILFAGAWLSEVESEEPNFFYLTQVLEEISQLALEWQVESLFAGAIQAIAIIQDEYLDNPNAAMETLGRIGSLQWEIERHIYDQRAKLLFRQKEYLSALEIWEKILPGWKTHRYSSMPAYSARLAAISCSHLGEWKKSAQLFSIAAELAHVASHNKLNVIL